VDSNLLLQRVEQLQQRHRDEVHLLNQQVRLPKLAVWDGPRGEWRSPQGHEGAVRTPVRVVHLWADYCPPCRAEMPRLKRMAQQLYADSKREVQFVFISETIDPEAMKKFLRENHTAMPSGMQYGDTNHDLMVSLMQSLPQLPQAPPSPGEHNLSRELPLPVTLVMDDEDVVRLAFVGSVEGRQGELVNGIEQLQKTLKARGAPADRRAPMIAGQPGHGNAN